MHKLDIIRYNSPHDFTKALKPFQPQKCARCGKTPENPLWSVCGACLGIVDATIRQKKEQESLRKARNTHNVVQANRARRNRVTCTCEVCGKQFERQPNQVKIRKHLYCSVKCSAKGSSIVRLQESKR